MGNVPSKSLPPSRTPSAPSTPCSSVPTSPRVSTSTPTRLGSSPLVRDHPRTHSRNPSSVGKNDHNATTASSVQDTNTSNKGRATTMDPQQQSQSSSITAGSSSSSSGSTSATSVTTASTLSSSSSLSVPTKLSSSNLRNKPLPASPTQSPSIPSATIMNSGPLTTNSSMVESNTSGSKVPQASPVSERSSISASRSSYNDDNGTCSITTTSSRSRESLGQLSLQRFPTGESENRVKTTINSRGSQLQPSQQNQHQLQQQTTRPTSPSLGSNSKSSRATSVVSTGSGRSSSGSGFRFPKPNLSFKPLYSHGNDSKNHQPSHGSHPHQHRSTPDLYANSPFPPVLLTIRLPQSLLNKYVIDQESFWHGKGIWGIGKYSWTVTVLSRSTGKKYVIKRVSKSLLPPSAYYHYPTTAHQLCTCPACRSSRDQLLLTGQLNPSDMDNIQEVLIIQNKGRRKELPQLPSPQPSQSHQRPLSASSVNTPTSATPKDKRRSFNMYSCNNASQPNPGRFLGFSPISSPQETPTNSRPTTPSPSPLRQQTTIPFPAPLSPSDPLSSLQTKTHRSPGQQPHPSSPSQFTPTSQSPLLPSATPPSWPQSDQNINQSLTGASFVPPSSGLVSQQDKTASSELSLDRVWTSPWTDISSGRRTRPNSPKPPSSSPIQFHEAGRGGEGVFVPMIPSRSASGSKKRPTLQRHKSTPNLSRPVTGLDSLEEDPMRLDQIRNLSKLNLNDRLNNDDNLVSKDTHLVDSPLSTTFTLPILARSNTKGGLGVKADTHLRKNGSDESHRWSREVAEVVERRVDPLDTQGGEFKRIEPEGPRSKPVEIEYTPPPHALPMELVLLQTFNDSDHLPEHHEWTQDKDYWYYVTKAHGVKRRKLKKVSSWWLDMSSLGGALLSGSSPSSEPIATGPIYNMGRSSPLPSSPLSSEVALSRHMPKGSISSLTSQDSSVGSMTPTMAHAPVSASKKPSSPRNSHLGKYYYVDWEEYTSL